MADQRPMDLVVEIAFTMYPVGTGIAGDILVLDDPTVDQLDAGFVYAGPPAPVWTDVTSRVRGTTTWQRGYMRQDGVYGKYQAGTLQVTLDNHDRYLDPTFDAAPAPYTLRGVSQARPKKLIRLRAVQRSTSTSYTLLTAFVDDFPADYTDPGDAWVTVTATDVVGEIAAVLLPLPAPVGFRNEITQWPAEDAGARIARILTAVGLAHYIDSLDVGTKAIGSSALGTDAWSEMQLTADTEGGELYVTADGGVVFRNQTAITSDDRSTTSQATFSDLEAEGWPYEKAPLTSNIDILRNRILVQGPTHLAQADDPTSQRRAPDGFGVRSWQPSSNLLFVLDADADAYAAWALAILKDPEVSFSTLDLKVISNESGSYIADVFGRELGDRITVKRRPTDFNNPPSRLAAVPVTRDVFVRSVAGSISPTGEWDLSWELQSATHFDGPPPPTVPDPPTAVTADAGAAQATISWAPPANDGGLPIASYTVTSSPGAHSATTPDGVTFSATVTGLTNGTSYTFTVVATNALGDSAPSSPSNAVVPAAGASAPTVSSLSPASGSTAGGTSVTLTGTHLGTPTAVSFGNVPAASFSVISSTHVQAVTPVHTAGKFHVKVTTASGISANVPGNIFQFNAPAVPAVTGISPTTGTTAGGDTVTVTGTDLLGATAVHFGANPATSVVVDPSGTFLTCVTPAGTGTQDVTVTTPGGTSPTSSADQFGYTAAGVPAVTSVSPNTGTTAGGDTIDVFGTNLTGTTAVVFGVVAAASFSVISSTHVQAVTPVHTAGKFHVKVTTAAGTSSTSTADLVTFATPTAGLLSMQYEWTGQFYTSHTITLDDAAAYDVITYQPQQITGAGSFTIPQLKAAAAAASPARAGLYYQYINGSHITGVDVNDPNFTPGAVGNPPTPVQITSANQSVLKASWYRYDPTGKKVVDPQWGTTVANPSSPGFQAFKAKEAQEAIARGADGAFLDSCGSGAPSFNKCIDPNVLPLAKATIPNWESDCSDFGHYIGTHIGAVGNTSPDAIGNGLTNANAYNAGASGLYAKPLYAAMAEGYLRAATAGLTAWPVYADWIAMLHDATVTKGCRIHLTLKVWVACTAAQRDQWWRIGVATLLCGHKNRASSALGLTAGVLRGVIGPGQGKDLTRYPIMALSIGDPTTPGTAATLTGGVYHRAFDAGLVLLNPTGGPLPYTLPGSGGPFVEQVVNGAGTALVNGTSHANGTVVTVSPNDALFLHT